MAEKESDASSGELGTPSEAANTIPETQLLQTDAEIKRSQKKSQCTTVPSARVSDILQNFIDGNICLSIQEL